MHLHRSLFAVAALSLIPASTVLAQAAQAAAAATTGELRFQVGDVMVRRWHDQGVAKAAMSDDAGRTWRSLKNPDDRLHFVLADFDPRESGMTLPGVMGQPERTRLFLVQFQTQILEQYQHDLQQRGVEILHYMPENALYVRCDRSAADELRKLAWVRWVGGLQNGFKLDATLREFAGAGQKEPKECNLILSSKADRATLAAQIAALGGEVTSLCEGSVMIQAKLTSAQLLAVLEHDTVTWADPTTAAGKDMDHARVQGGANYIETLAGFAGNGVRAEITESFQELHPDFGFRVTVRAPNSTDAHGQCTAGIVGAEGTNNLNARGMMPLCLLTEGAYQPNAHYSQILGSVNPAMPWRTMVATASWGSAVTTAYTSISQNMDNALFDSDLTRLNSQSNQGDQNSRPEAWAKNVIAVGGVDHSNNSNPADDAWSSASYGPASDGRMKPEICSYYDSVLTTDLVSTAGYNASPGVTGNYYSAFNGTSAATPIVAGHVGLIQEMFTDGLFGNALPLPATAANRFGNKPHMTTSRALLCGTARPYPLAQVERRKQGWGFPDLARLYDNRNNIVVVDEYAALQQGQRRMYFVWVPPGAADFRAVMCYSDPAGQASASIQRVNDLNLKVTRISDGTAWWGNNGLWTNDQSTPGGLPNGVDTLEYVLLNNPQDGMYAVTVEAAAIVQDGKVETPAMDADFALVILPTGGGFHNASGMTIDLQASAPGVLTVDCANVPPTGWTDGYTFFSLNTSQPKGFGNWFGIEFDFLVSAIWTLPATTADVFHFPNIPGLYPTNTYAFPPSLVSALAGFTVDAQVTLLNNGQIVAQSGVDRVTLQ